MRIYFHRGCCCCCCCCFCFSFSFTNGEFHVVVFFFCYFRCHIFAIVVAIAFIVGGVRADDGAVSDSDDDDDGFLDEKKFSTVIAYEPILLLLQRLLACDYYC